MASFNTAEGFFRSVARHADRAFYCDAARTVSYGEMGAVVQRLAGCLSRKGARGGSASWQRAASRPMRAFSPPGSSVPPMCRST